MGCVRSSSIVCVVSPHLPRSEAEGVGCYPGCSRADGLCLVPCRSSSCAGGAGGAPYDLCFRGSCCDVERSGCRRSRVVFEGVLSRLEGRPCPAVGTTALLGVSGGYSGHRGRSGGGVWDERVTTEAAKVAREPGDHYDRGRALGRTRTDDHRATRICSHRVRSPTRGCGPGRGGRPSGRYVSEVLTSFSAGLQGC
jgi:hypothetical protein